MSQINALIMPASKTRYSIVSNCAVTLIGLALHCFSVAAEPAPQARNFLGYSNNNVNDPSAVMARPMAADSGRTTGSWVNSTNGPGIFHRGTISQAPQIAPVGRAVKSASRTRRVNWRYSFLTPVPNGLQAYLCNYVRCISLDAAIGTTTAFDGDSAYSNFAFAFVIKGSGGLTPALQGQLNYVAVHYE